MKKGCICLFALILLLAQAALLHAAEVKNVQSSQVGNRVQFTYDLTGEEREAEVTVNLTVPGGDSKTDDLHLEGDVGKVKPGRGKVIWWNVLQDFPRGLNSEIAWEITAGGQSFTDATTGMEFVFVKGGCYEMGDTFGGGSGDEKPIHNVCVSDFYMGKYEVTQRQWQAVMGSNPSKNTSWFGKTDNCPVEQVNWNDTQDFIVRLNEKTGKSYRLPTESEWEYAARSGGKKEKYAGMSNDSGLGDYAWYIANSGSSTHSVGGKTSNGLGLYDMTGNGWEWCQDWYGEKYYGESPRNNPRGPSSGQYRVLRGGSWDSNQEDVRTATRNWNAPVNRNSSVGFRLSLSAP
ncbi:MAG: SUMF1/EgtB/PvdO family nonheme iron enzyme [Deltaproteobacteria bacterium]